KRGSVLAATSNDDAAVLSEFSDEIADCLAGVPAGTRGEDVLAGAPGENVPAGTPVGGGSK
ncbi:MAG: hypothetical protein ACTH44_05505, partial [Brevibacterium aurantiacum]|uniref:hypothetical protein n=1 Tax=Brevibacterium aurantiacum TaxID=273384 RepID=UPI003F8F0E6A